MGDKKNKRILWIFAHTTLRHFEMPIFQELGYEIFCPKKFTIDAGDLSASISYEYDKTLTIPQEDIEYLNGIDFFSELSQETLSIINKHFGIAFVMLCKECFRSLILGFQGTIVLHVFGLPGKGSYGNVLFDLLGVQLYLQLRKLGDRFIFSYTYENIIEIEPDILRNHGVYMPIGIRETINNEWKGGDERLLFICPKINSNSYFHTVYKWFKDNFGDIPHVIGGAQIIEVTDDTVTGFLSREEYDYNMTSLCGMLYHSQEPRHIHYHPIEAMRNGMPVLFMAGGMLDYLGGKKLPGRCKNIKEARKKIHKLSKNNKYFIRRVVKAQERILKYYTTEYCFPYWKEAMGRIEQSIDSNKIKRQKRVAVILPDVYTGGVLDYSLRFTVIIKKYSEKYNDDIEVIFSHLNAKCYDEKTFKILRDNNIKTRIFWKDIRTSDWIKNTYDFLGINPEKINLECENKVTTFCDGMENFKDCDYCFIMADSFEYPLFLLTPYAIVVHDYIQRYLPNMMSKEVIYAKERSQRTADYILTTSKPTYEDAINYAANSPEKVKITPPLFSINNISCDVTKEELYFIWSTNASQHKNHLVVLDALKEYYEKGGKYSCFVTGTNTEVFKKEGEVSDYNVSQEYVSSVKSKINNINKKGKKIFIKGNLEKEQYYELLCKSTFVLLPQYGDNGNFTVVDAASCGIPSICSKYPAQQYMNDYLGIKAIYFNPFSKNELVEALFKMESEYLKISICNPTKNDLEKFDYLVQGEELYKIVKSIIKA